MVLELGPHSRIACGRAPCSGLGRLRLLGVRGAILRRSTRMESSTLAGSHGAVGCSLLHRGHQAPRRSSAVAVGYAQSPPGRSLVEHTRPRRRMRAGCSRRRTSIRRLLLGWHRLDLPGHRNLQLAFVVRRHPPRRRVSRVRGHAWHHCNRAALGTTGRDIVPPSPEAIAP